MNIRPIEVIERELAQTKEYAARLEAELSAYQETPMYRLMLAKTMVRVEEEFRESPRKVYTITDTLECLEKWATREREVGQYEQALEYEAKIIAYEAVQSRIEEEVGEDDSKLVLELELLEMKIKAQEEEVRKQEEDDNRGYNPFGHRTAFGKSHTLYLMKEERRKLELYRQFCIERAARQVKRKVAKEK